MLFRRLMRDSLDQSKGIMVNWTLPYFSLSRESLNITLTKMLLSSYKEENILFICFQSFRLGLLNKDSAGKPSSTVELSITCKGQYRTCFLCTVHVSCVQYMFLVYNTCFLCTVHVSCVQYMFLVYSTCFLCTVHVSCVQNMFLVYNTCFLCTVHVSCVQYMFLVSTCFWSSP